MKKENFNMWSNISFKTIGYRKNFDMVNVNENIISDYLGKISLLRITENKSPLIIGEYDFCVINLKLGRMFKFDLTKLISEHAIEESYNELLNILNNNSLDIERYNRILLINNVIIHPKYRKQGVMEEFIEAIYRDYYDEKIAIIAMVKPFQNNSMDFNYFMNDKTVEVRDTIKTKPVVVLASDYYELNDLIKKMDTEINEYKLFSIAVRCGFNRIDETYLFIYEPDKTIERLMSKHQMIKSNNNF